jgi:hypothetical protein
MDVGFNRACHGEVNDKDDVLHIDAMPSQIRSDQDIGVSVAWCLQCRLTLFLLPSGVQCRGSPL